MPKYKEVEWKKRTNKGYEVIVAPDGHKEWYLNGKLHRKDGPAVIRSSGIKLWYLKGKKHREDGPAVIHPDGYKAWLLNGKRHREDGPAIIRPDGHKEWWLNGKILSKEDFTIEMIKRMNVSELFTVQELAKLRLDESS